MTEQWKQRREDHWYIKKEINAGYILTSILMLLMIVAGWIDLDKRTQDNTLTNKFQDEKIEANMVIYNTTMNEIKLDVREIRNTVVNHYGK